MMQFGATFGLAEQLATLGFDHRPKPSPAQIMSILHNSPWGFRYGKTDTMTEYINWYISTLQKPYTATDFRRTQTRLHYRTLEQPEV